MDVYYILGIKVFLPISVMIVLHVRLFLMCLWEEVSSASSYSAILISSHYSDNLVHYSLNKFLLYAKYETDTILTVLSESWLFNEENTHCKTNLE